MLQQGEQERHLSYISVAVMIESFMKLQRYRWRSNCTQVLTTILTWRFTWAISIGTMSIARKNDILTIPIYEEMWKADFLSD